MSIYRALQVAFYRGKIVFFTTYGDALPYIAFVAENCYNNSVIYQCWEALETPFAPQKGFTLYG